MVDLLMDQLKYLPSDIIAHIFETIPNEALIFVSKDYYEKYHHNIRGMIHKSMYDSYLRFVIKKDYTYILELLLDEEFNIWSIKTRTVYKNNIYPSYFALLTDLSIQYSANRCKKMLNDRLVQSGFTINKYKKTRSINNYKWNG